MITTYENASHIYIYEDGELVAIISKGAGQ